MHRQVVVEIIDRNLCSGCGVCTGICPAGNLSTVWAENGDLSIEFRGSCPDNCNICLHACPFNHSRTDDHGIATSAFGNNSGMEYDDLVGYYLATFVGHSRVSGHRKKGASGGMATWILEELLERKLIDAVACVVKSTSSNKQFEFRILDSTSEIRAAAGSKYYPVGIGNVIKEILCEDSNRKFAVTGLPCMLRGLRYAMEANPKLKRRVRYMVGLVCGHLPNRLYTDYLISLSGLQPGLISDLSYRVKEGAERAANFRFIAVDADGERSMPLPYFGWPEKAWAYLYFQHNACNFCKDIFAEMADVSLMDAWLPRYEKDPSGHSLLVVRNEEILNVLDEGARKESCALRPIPREELILSQTNSVDIKRTLYPGREYYYIRKGRPIPGGVAAPSREVYLKNRMILRSYLRSQEASKRLWLMFGSRMPHLFNIVMLCYSWPLYLRELRTRLHRVIEEPHRLKKLLPLWLRKIG